MAFTISWGPGKVPYVNNALFYMMLVFRSLGAVWCIMVTKIPPKPALMHISFSAECVNVIFLKIAQLTKTKSSNLKAALTALLLLVNSSTCKNMHLHNKR